MGFRFPHSKLVLILLLHLSILFLTSYSHPEPTYPPLKPPYYPPVTPPTPPPAIYIPRRPPPVAVQGQVYCKNCSDVGIDGATPLAGAKVLLRCQKRIVFGYPKPARMAITDKNGNFFMLTPKSVNYTTAVSNCRVYLSKPPRRSRCSRRTNFNGGIKGGRLTPVETFVATPYALFSAGLFAFCLKH